MSKRMGKVWEAPAHTKAKIAILGAYLDAWLPILATARPDPILYIDGFAGPGKYSNGEQGSPAKALERAKEAILKHSERWTAREVRMMFLEDDPDRAANLEKVLAHEDLPPRIKASVMRGDFVTCLGQLQKTMPSFFTTSQPLFAFIDPFGVKGVPFETVRQLLASPTSEVLLNFDADGVMRVHGAGEHANHQEILRLVYGGDEWEAPLAGARAFEDECRLAADLYMKKLREVAGAKYVFRFEMRGKTDALNYYLIFASNNWRGLEKMKEAMKTVDQDGSFRFSDGRVGQQVLFRFDDPAYHATQMHSFFQSQEVAWEQIRDYTLNESPFTRPGVMLEVLEERQMLRVTAKHRQRKKRQFSEDAILSVRFVDPQEGLFDGRA